MKCRYFIESIIEKLLKDERIRRKEGTINSYSRYSYKKKMDFLGYEEVLQVGFKVSILINEYSEGSTWVTLYVWAEDNENKIFIKNSLYDEIRTIKMEEERRIINTVIGLILEKEIRNEFNKVINL